jgi:hypothetical protein
LYYKNLNISIKISKCMQEHFFTKLLRRINVNIAAVRAGRLIITVSVSDRWGIR